MLSVRPADPTYLSFSHKAMVGWTLERAHSMGFVGFGIAALLTATVGIPFNPLEFPILASLAILVLGVHMARLMFPFGGIAIRTRTAGPLRSCSLHT